MKTNPSDYFLSGFYERYWEWQLQDEDPVQTARQIVRLLGAQSGRILDWCGGWGRIALEFARLGFSVSILDIVRKYLDRAEASFREANLSVKTICADCRETPKSIQADYAVCLFNTVGFFDDNDQTEAFRSLLRALKPKSKIIVDCMNLFFIAANFQTEMESRKNEGTVYKQTNRFNALNNRMVSEFAVEDASGNRETRDFDQKLYTPFDLARLLETAGFTNLQLFSDYNGSEFTLLSPKIVIVAEKHS